MDKESGVAIEEVMQMIAKPMATVERQIDSGELSYCRVDGLDGIRVPLTHEIAAEFGIERGQTVNRFIANAVALRCNAETEARLAILKAKQEKPA